MAPPDPLPETHTPSPATESQPPTVTAPSLLLALSEDGKALNATFTPFVAAPPPSATASPDATAPPGASAEPAPAPAPARHPPLTPDGVRTQIKAQGFGALALDETALAKLVQQSATVREPLTLKVAERRDARCAVNVSRDRMSGVLTLTPPQGGEPLTLEQVKAALADKGVKAGLLEDVLAAAVAKGEASELEIAQGKKAVNGEHTRFEKLVPEMTDRHPRVNQHGLIDYRDLGDLVVVRPGTPLMRRIPPTPGEPGHDVTGNVLSPKPGTNHAFAPGLKGTEVDRNDPNLLLATVTGQPVMVSRGVKVDPNVIFQQVDMASGNVNFDGAINIKGDVKEGMRVFSTGDVYVGGTVEAGEIEAGGNVIVKGGVIGRNEYNGRSSGRNAWFNAKITAKGSISARYAENAYLSADVDVMLEDYAMHSEITALNHVVIGQPGGRKGRCMGGHTRATLSIRLAESGSPAGMQTVLEAGFNPLVTEELAALTQSIQKHEAEIANLQKIIDFVHAHPDRDKDGLLGRATLTQELHQGQILELQQEQANLQMALTLVGDAHIDVELAIHGGTEVHLGGKVWTTTDKRAHGVFRLNEEGELVLQ